MKFIENILDKMYGLGKTQKKFLLVLFPTILLMRGKVNFRNMSRYSELCEKTYSRNFRKEFDFPEFNRLLLEEQIEPEHEKIAAMDCSFCPKSGSKTYGKDNFFNSTHNKPEKGLEISVLSVVDVPLKEAYTLSSVQTPSLDELRKRYKDRISIDKDSVSYFNKKEYQDFLDKFPHADKILKPVIQKVGKRFEIKVKKITDKKKEQLGEAPYQIILEHTITRIDFYLNHFLTDMNKLPSEVKYLAVDGFYAKKKFVDGVVDSGKHLIGKLRCDANLRHLYQGPHPKRQGAKKKYDGKVDFNDLSQFEYVGEPEKNIHLYTQVLNSVTLKRNIRVVLILNTKDKNNIRYAILFSTDIELNALKIYEYYKSRFQIEFIFRDAKQFLGLCDCQATCEESLHFHFNASLAALNIAKIDAKIRFRKEPDQPFSMASQKVIYFNEHLLSRFILMSELDLTLKNYQEAFLQLSSYGAINSFNP